MGRPRNELHQILETLGAGEVYFQPPSMNRMVFPCIIYELDSESVQYADNKKHRSDMRYTVTVIDRNPDSDIPKGVAALPLCSFSRFFVANNLNHFVYNLYF